MRCFRFCTTTAWLVVFLTVSACAHVSPQHDNATPFAIYGAHWSWTDDSGHVVQLEALRGHVVVLSMFFRSCSFACPVTLARMQGLEQAFQERGVDARFVLVTLDPRHDTPPRLAAFRALHKLAPERWSLLTGSLQQTIALSHALAIHRIEDDTHIIHDVKILIIRADGSRTRSFEGFHFDDATALAL